MTETQRNNLFICFGLTGAKIFLLFARILSAFTSSWKLARTLYTQLFSEPGAHRGLPPELICYYCGEF